jgi:hypothetical protein
LLAVEHHNRGWVWSRLPEKGRFSQPKTLDRGDQFGLYITIRSPTTTTEVQMRLTEKVCPRISCAAAVTPLVILGKNGMPFRHLRDAEK